MKLFENISQMIQFQILRKRMSEASADSVEASRDVRLDSNNNNKKSCKEFIWYLGCELLDAECHLYIALYSLALSCIRKLVANPRIFKFKNNQTSSSSESRRCKVLVVRIIIILHSGGGASKSRRVREREAVAPAKQNYCVGIESSIRFEKSFQVLVLFVLRIVVHGLQLLLPDPFLLLDHTVHHL